MSANLVATLVVDHVAVPEAAAQLVARCALGNDGDEATTVNLAPLSSPSLALELADERGEPVHLPPPPVPSEDVPLKPLAPGERITVDFAGFLPAWTPPGRYRARFRYIPGASAGRWHESNHWSRWVEFQHG